VEHLGGFLTFSNSFLGFGSDYSATYAHFRILMQDHVQEQTVAEYAVPEPNTARLPPTTALFQPHELLTLNLMWCRFCQDADLELCVLMDLGNY
jgi:hypothetical protein